MSYIPHGADQQGRRITGVWTSDDIGRAWRAPHRTGADFVDTTDLAPFEAAHAASEIDDVPTFKRRHGLRLVAAVSAVAVLALVVIVSTMGAA